jgi:hypothetical protein
MTTRMQVKLTMTPKRTHDGDRDFGRVGPPEDSTKNVRRNRGARASTSTPQIEDKKSRQSVVQLKYHANIRIGTYHDIVINYNFTDDFLSGKDTTEWPEVEATKEKYPSKSRNQDIVEEPEADITKVSTKIDLAALSYKAKAGKRGYTKSLMDNGCNRHMFSNRELFQDFVETLIPIKTAGNTIYAMGVGTVGKLRGCLCVPNLPINLISPFQAMEDINGLKIDLELNKCTLWQKFNKFAPIVMDVPDRLIKVTDYSWMGLDKWDEEAIQDKIRDKSVAMKNEYIR